MRAKGGRRECAVPARKAAAVRTPQTKTRRSIRSPVSLEDGGIVESYPVAGCRVPFRASPVLLTLRIADFLTVSSDQRERVFAREWVFVRCGEHRFGWRPCRPVLLTLRIANFLTMSSDQRERVSARCGSTDLVGGPAALYY